MKNINNLKAVLIFFLALISCSDDDMNYHDLSEEAKSFLTYEIGDTFKLKEINTDNEIIFTVDSKNFFYEEYTYTGLFSIRENYYEKGEYSFSDNSNCYTGIISVEASNTTLDYDFRMTISLGECFGDFTAYYEDEDEIQNINIEGKSYENAYFFKSTESSIFYNSEKGLLKIENSDEILYLISE